MYYLTTFAGHTPSNQNRGPPQKVLLLLLLFCLLNKHLPEYLSDSPIGLHFLTSLILYNSLGTKQEKPEAKDSSLLQPSG